MTTPAQEQRKAQVIADMEARAAQATKEYNQKVENKCAAMNRMYNYINDVQPRFAALLDQNLRFKKDGTLHAKFLPAFQELYRDVKGLRVSLEWGTTNIWLHVSGSYMAIDCHGNNSSNQVREDVYLGQRDNTGVTKIADFKQCQGVTPKQYHAAKARIKQLEEQKQNIVAEIVGLNTLIDE